MHCAMIRTFGAPAEAAEVENPEPGPDEVEVIVKAAGLCGTDLKIKSGAFDLPLPLIPGHEIAGEIVAVGPGVPSGRIGERVACYYYSTCEKCERCLTGQENLCASVRRLGFERPGGMAERVVCPAAMALPIADEVSYPAAAAAMDALTTPLRALQQKLRVEPGESVLIVGSGGLGLNAVQVATALGAHVAVAEPVAERRARAVERGAEYACAPDDADLRAWGRFPPDVVLEVSGTAAGLALAAGTVRPGGRVGVLGYQPTTQLSIGSQRLVLDEVNIQGIRGGSLATAAEALRRLALGELTIDIGPILGLSDVNRAYEMLQGGKQTGRIVVAPD